MICLKKFKSPKPALASVLGAMAVSLIEGLLINTLGQVTVIFVQLGGNATG